MNWISDAGIVSEPEFLSRSKAKWNDKSYENDYHKAWHLLSSDGKRFCVKWNSLPWLVSSWKAIQPRLFTLRKKFLLKIFGQLSDEWIHYHNNYITKASWSVWGLIARKIDGFVSSAPLILRHTFLQAIKHDRNWVTSFPQRIHHFHYSRSEPSALFVYIALFFTLLLWWW